MSRSASKSPMPHHEVGDLQRRIPHPDSRELQTRNDDDGLEAEMKERLRRGREQRKFEPFEPIGQSQIPDRVRRGQRVVEIVRDADIPFSGARAALEGLDYRQLTFQDILQGSNMVDTGRIIRDDADFRQRFSSIEGTNDLIGLINVVMLSAFVSEPDTTEGWVRSVPMPNFLAAKAATVGEVSRLESVPRGGVAHYTSLSIAEQGWRLHRTGTQFQIDEEDMYDQESIGTMMTAVEEIGREARRVPLDLVYATILANAPTSDGVATFHADHGNLVTTALDATALGVAIGAIGDQVLTDPQDENISHHLNLGGKYLMVAPQLTATARGLARNLKLEESADLLVRSESRIGSKGVVDLIAEQIRTGAATHWMLAAPAAERPCVLLGGLNGEPRPRVRTFSLGIGEWGVGVDVSLHVGCTIADWRGLYFSTGAGE